MSITEILNKKEELATSITNAVYTRKPEEAYDECDKILRLLDELKQGIIDYQCYVSAAMDVEVPEYC